MHVCLSGAERHSETQRGRREGQKGRRQGSEERLRAGETDHKLTRKAHKGGESREGYGERRRRFKKDLKKTWREKAGEMGPVGGEQLERERLSLLGNRRKAHTSSKHSLPCSVLQLL